MKTVAVIIIGDEILLGRVTDTNSGAIARAVDRIGAKVTRIVTVGDNYNDISQALDSCLASADIVFTTGGLGPTKDDITKKVFLDFFNDKLVEHKATTANIRGIFEARGLELNRLTLDQALVPSSSHVIVNTFGTAPIMVFRHNDKFIVAMPGVPSEMEGMLPEVLRYLVVSSIGGDGFRHTTRILTGITESGLAERLDNFENNLPKGFKLAYLPESPIIKLRLDGPADSPEYDSTLNSLDEELSKSESVTLLATEDKTLAEIVVDRLKTLDLTLSTAESCTGGNIARLLTSVPGSSAVFNGGVVSYANSAKMNVLGVGSETLATHGAVSRPVVVQMADGACNALSTDCAVATSGIAGPSGGTPDKPVGTVWIGVKTPRGTVAELYHFRGNRLNVIHQASAKALILLLTHL